METKDRYEAAIERLKQWDREHKDRGYIISERDEFIFPELKESEDERLRIRIYGLIYHNDALLDKDKLLAWLEKQKEANDFGELMNKLSAKEQQIMFDAWDYDEKKTLEKQKEQKELPLMDGNADLYFDEWNQQKQNPTKRQCFEEGMIYAERLQKEQKPIVIHTPRYSPPEQKPAEKSEIPANTDLDKKITEYITED